MTFVASVGEDTTAAEYRAATEAAEYGERPEGLDNMPWSRLRTSVAKGAGVGFGLLVAGETLYYSFYDHEKLDQIQ
jgi:hypothetical protein